MTETQQTPCIYKYKLFIEQKTTYTIVCEYVSSDNKKYKRASFWFVVYKNNRGPHVLGPLQKSQVYIISLASLPGAKPAGLLKGFVRYFRLTGVLVSGRSELVFLLCIDNIASPEDV